VERKRRNPDLRVQGKKGEIEGKLKKESILPSLKRERSASVGEGERTWRATVGEEEEKGESVKRH